jgi:HSP20 family protein
MRRRTDLFPVRWEQEGGLTPWSGTGLESPETFFTSSPWQMMRRMQEDMDRVFSQFFTSPDALAGTTGEVTQWTPSVDISQDDKEWLIEAELPGVGKDNIDVQVQNGHLILRAELRQQEDQPQEGGERRYQRRERRYGFFERVLPLPQAVDEEQIQCEFRDGVLTVHVPKTPEARPQVRRIPIGEGAAQQPATQAQPGQGQQAEQSKGNGERKPRARAA